jgi:hypothetical protein
MSQKKRCIGLVLLALAFAIFVMISCNTVEARTQEYSGEVLSGENIDIDQFTFIITMNKYASAIFVDGGTIFTTVQRETCKKMEHFEVCFDNTTYNEDDNELYAIVRVFRYEPTLTITRVANDTELYIGQKAQIKITIENTGDTASEVIMTDDYPTAFEISEMEGGCRFHENQVYWQGHLDEDEKKECTFLIRAMNETHRSMAAHLKYWDGFKYVDEYSSAMTIDVLPLITIYSRTVQEDFEEEGTTFDFEEDNPGAKIGETIRLLVNISNNYDERIDIDALDIYLPEYTEYKSISSLRFNFKNAAGNRSSIVWSSERVNKINNILRWTGSIGTNKSSKLFIIKLQMKRSGRQNIIINTKYDLEGTKFTDTRTETVDVNDAGINVHMTVEDTAKRFSAPTRLDAEDNTIDLEALHPYNVKIYAQNPNPFAELGEARFKVKTDIAGLKETYYPLFEKEVQKIPYSFVLIPPQVSASKEFKANVSFIYTNEFNERYENGTEFLLTVTPSKDLTISFDSSEGEVLNGGEETEIKVSITNDRLVDLKDVSVKDQIPEGLHVEGVHAKKVKLNKESDTEVYTYRITAPIVHNKTRYDIITTASFFDPDSRMQLNYSENTTITVEPLEPTVSFEATMDEPTDIYPGTIIPVEYTVSNDETKELIRDITIYFPIQQEMDLIGPKTFFIDKLDPGEEITIKDVVKLRPKVVDESLELNKTLMKYYDNYGNQFSKNSTEDTLDVQDARISGPSLFLKTKAPTLFNRSTEGKITIAVKNNGSADTEATVTQMDKTWTLKVPAGDTQYIEYGMKYDKDGNYTIPDPEAQYDVQGMNAITKGTGTSFEVLLIEGPLVQEALPNVTAEAKPAEAAPEQEKEQLSIEELEAIKKQQATKTAIRYGIIAAVIIIAIVVIMAYFYFAKRKGPAKPFIEG